MTYISKSIELGQFNSEQYDSIKMKYQQERKYLNLVIFASEKDLKIYDSQTYQSYDTLSRGYKNVYVTTKPEQADKLIAHSVRDTLGIKTKPKGVTSFKELTDLESYNQAQARYLEIETLRHFLTIVQLLKENDLESTIEIYQGKNVHELVRDIEASLATEGVTQATLLKIATLYESKKMNPPYYFSWEFMAGTYLPFMSPFVIAMGQILMRVVKNRKG